MTTIDLVTFALLGDILTVSKQMMAALPNIEPVSILIIIYAIVYGRKSILAVFLFIFLEVAHYGLNLWNIYYLYTWPLLWLVSYLLRSVRSAWIWAIVSGLFGLSFGGLCAIAHGVAFGISSGYAWWLNGLPFDVTHGIGNFCIGLVAFHPLYHAFQTVKRLSSMGNPE